MPEEISVLLIEENAQGAVPLARMLDQSQAGRCSVHFANSIPTAIRRMGAGGIDVVLFSAATSDGAELGVVRNLRAGAPARIPIIVISDRQDQEFVCEVMRAGAQDCLVRNQVTSPVLFRSILCAIERQSAEISLRHERSHMPFESSQMLQFVLDHMPAFVFWKDRNSVYRGCNALFAANAGLSSPEEIIGKTDLDLPWKHTEAESYRVDDQKVMGSGIAKLNYEETQLTADGRLTTVRTSKIPLRNSDGSVVGILGTFEDFTERKLAEESLRRLNRELRAISDCTQTLLRATDEQSLVQEICRIVCDEAGYRMAWVGYAQNDDVKSIRPIAWAGFENGYLAETDIRWSEQTEHGRGPAGTAIRSGETSYTQDFANDVDFAPREAALERGYRSCICLPLKDERAKTFGILAIYSPETDAFSPQEIRMLEELAADLAFGIKTLRARIERAQAEEALALRSHALNTVHEAAYLLDENARVLYVNEEACRLLGYSREQLLKMSVFDVDPEMSAELWPQHWADLKAQQSITMERYHRSIDGLIRLFEVNANYCEYGGKGYNLALARDISERKQAEDEKAKLLGDLQQAQKMEAVGQLAGGVAHDFNNILGVIIGYSEILLRTAELEEKNRGYLQEVVFAAQRAASLTRQLLAFSRRLVSKPKLINVNDVVERMGKMLARLIGDEIEIQTRLDPALNAVSADPHQMEQVLMNFCINARDAMPEGGRITIETTNVDVNETTAVEQLRLRKQNDQFLCPMCGEELKPGKYIKLSVSDTGIGMTQEVLTHVFEPFFTTKSPERGTGLGLATVYGIVKQAGGHVLVDSRAGHGSTFSLYWPTAALHVHPHGEETARIQNTRGTETILLVEDAAPLRALFYTIAVGNGYRVLEAEDGERAMQVAEQFEGEIDLLLTDVSLPKLRGPALAKQLLLQRPKMKVLFMSGYSDAVSDGLTDPGASFLQKPFSAEELTVRIRELLDGGRDASSIRQTA
ncbi:MAG TPA: PAS domain S-box protein [Candidatus Acidoferrales bacterium]|nr:PAS domain S-box protein [Candidatus Acidoferrales bacterium]